MVNRIGAPGGVASRAARILFTILCILSPFVLSKCRRRCCYFKLTHYLPPGCSARSTRRAAAEHPPRLAGMQTRRQRL